MIQAFEKHAGVSRDENGDVEVLYVVVSDQQPPVDEDDVTACVLDKAPASRKTHETGKTLSRSGKIAVEELHDNLWTATVRYTTTTASTGFPPGVGSYAFNTTGGTAHITQSKEALRNYHDGVFGPATSTNAIYRGAIGVTEDGVEGCDIVVPVFEFEETHGFKDEDVTDGYLNTLFTLTGKTNSNAFKGCAAGECLFLGAIGGMRAGTDWEITFRFAASPNLKGLSVGQIGGIVKRGWEYMWVKYRQHEDTDLKLLCTIPDRVFIERVYDEADMSGLRIGNTRARRAA